MQLQEDVQDWAMGARQAVADNVMKQFIQLPQHAFMEPFLEMWEMMRQGTFSSTTFVDFSFVSADTMANWTDYVQRSGLQSARFERAVACMLGNIQADASAAPFEFESALKRTHKMCWYAKGEHGWIQLFDACEEYYMRNVPMRTSAHVINTRQRLVVVKASGERCPLVRIPEFSTDMSDDYMASIDDQTAIAENRFAPILNRCRGGVYTDDGSMAFVMLTVLNICGDFNALVFNMLLQAWALGGFMNHSRFMVRKRGSFGLGAQIGEAIGVDELDLHSVPVYAPIREKVDLYKSGNGCIMGGVGALAAFCCFKGFTLQQCVHRAVAKCKVTHTGVEAALTTALMAGMIWDKVQHDTQEWLAIDQMLEIWTAVQQVTEDMFPRQQYEEFYVSIDCIVESRAQTAELPKTGYSFVDRHGRMNDWSWRGSLLPPITNHARLESNPRYFGSYCLDCFTLALWCCDGQTKWDEVMRRAKQCLGDADSIAAVAGQLAGAAKLPEKYDFLGCEEANVLARVMLWRHRCDKFTRLID